MAAAQPQDDAQRDSVDDMSQARDVVTAQPEHSVYIQIIDFLLEVKATTVSALSSC